MLHIFKIIITSRNTSRNSCVNFQKSLEIILYSAFATANYTENTFKCQCDLSVNDISFVHLQHVHSIRSSFVQRTIFLLTIYVRKQMKKLSPTGIT